MNWVGVQGCLCDNAWQGAPSRYRELKAPEKFGLAYYDYLYMSGYI